jgi:cell wall-associated NlpC family hydrolase
MNDSMLVQYALRFVGTPYLWGGDDPHGWDCSGLVQELLAAQGKDPPGDQTAQGLYDYYSNDTILGWRDHREVGSLAFFGSSPTKITHVAMLLDRDTMIEAGGGGKSTTSEDAAWKANAYVRVRKLLSRKDLIAVIFPY